VNFTARPTMYRGIQMRSRLEARAAQILDAKAIAWEYEPCCFASEDGQYLPDFRLDGTIYVEVKPRPVFDDPAQLAVVQKRMQVIRASEPTATLAVWAPETGEAWMSYGDSDHEWCHHGPWFPSDDRDEPEPVGTQIAHLRVRLARYLPKP
jgi:hypothetical protein